jgi:hypothetical protein
MNAMLISGGVEQTNHRGKATQPAHHSPSAGAHYGDLHSGENTVVCNAKTCVHLGVSGAGGRPFFHYGAEP